MNQLELDFERAQRESLERFWQLYGVMEELGAYSSREARTLEREEQRRERDIDWRYPENDQL